MSRTVGPAPKLGDVEAGILVAAEQVAQDPTYWVPTQGQPHELVGLPVVSIDKLRHILERLTLLRTQGGGEQ